MRRILLFTILTAMIAFALPVHALDGCKNITVDLTHTAANTVYLAGDEYVVPLFPLQNGNVILSGLITPPLGEDCGLNTLAHSDDGKGTKPHETSMDISIRFAFNTGGGVEQIRTAPLTRITAVDVTSGDRTTLKITNLLIPGDPGTTNTITGTNTTTGFKINGIDASLDIQAEYDSGYWNVQIEDTSLRIKKSALQRIGLGEEALELNDGALGDSPVATSTTGPLQVVRVFQKNNTGTEQDLEQQLTGAGSTSYALSSSNPIQITFEISNKREAYFDTIDSSYAIGTTPFFQFVSNYNTWNKDLTKPIDLQKTISLPGVFGPASKLANPALRNCVTSTTKPNYSNCTISFSSINGIPIDAEKTFQVRYYYDKTNNKTKEPADEFVLQFVPANKLTITPSQQGLPLAKGTEPGTFTLINEYFIETTFTKGKDPTRTKFIVVSGSFPNAKEGEKFTVFDNVISSENKNIGIERGKVYTATSKISMNAISPEAFIDSAKSYDLTVYYDNQGDGKIDKEDIYPLKFLPKVKGLDVTISQDTTTLERNTQDSTAANYVFSSKNLVDGKAMKISFGKIDGIKQVIVLSQFNSLDSGAMKNRANRTAENIDFTKTEVPLDKEKPYNIRTGINTSNCTTTADNTVSCYLLLKTVDDQPFSKSKEIKFEFIYDADGDNEFEREETYVISIRPDAPPCATLLECLAQMDKTIASKYIENK